MLLRLTAALTLAVGLVAGFGFLKQLIFGRKKEEEPAVTSSPDTPAE